MILIKLHLKEPERVNFTELQKQRKVIWNYRHFIDTGTKVLKQTVAGYKGNKSLHIFTEKSLHTI